MDHRKIGRYIQIAFAIYIAIRVIMTLREIITLSRTPKSKALEKVDTSRGILRGVYEHITARKEAN